MKNFTPCDARVLQFYPNPWHPLTRWLYARNAIEFSQAQCIWLFNPITQYLCHSILTNWKFLFLENENVCHLLCKYPYDSLVQPCPLHYVLQFSFIWKPSNLFSIIKAKEMVIFHLRMYDCIKVTNTKPHPDFHQCSGE